MIVCFDAIAGAVQIPLAKTGKVEHGFTQRFAGYGAGIDAHAPNDFMALDHADFLAEFGGLHGGFLAGRSGADDEKVVMSHPDPREG